MKKRVPSEKEIASKHGVSVEAIVKQAEIGSTVEREHVTTHEEAYGIALQHLDEFPDYYKHLLKMEKELKAQHKKKKTFKEMRESFKSHLSENHIDVAMGKELDDEGAMILNQIEELEHCCERLKNSISSPTMQIPGWVQAKVTLAADYMNSVASYMESKNEEVVYEEKKEKEEKKFCKLCQKPETQKECSYGPKAWERFSVPIPSVKKEEVEIEESAWTRKEGQNKNGGLNEKGRKSYERQNPGSDLKAPSKDKDNPRRKSFCARMKGMRKRQKDSNNTGEDRLSKSLRAWDC